MPRTPPRPRVPALRLARDRLATLLRSAIAGGAATVADVATLAAAMGLLHLPARVASIPALVVGGVVNFLGNRHYAFRAGRGSLAVQAVLYTLTEVVALALNGVLFDLAARTLHPTPAGAVALRLVTTNLVFLAWSYPLWVRVFRAPAEADGAPAPPR